ncbi:MAG: PQQ-binding-like beta-propeller repeat protein [Oligoflexus sp.]|nr:PQQ-binding-like beta-propeller repeat protein [Oligoflexus sp.]
MSSLSRLALSLVLTIPLTAQAQGFKRQWTQSPKLKNGQGFILKTLEAQTNGGVLAIGKTYDIASSGQDQVIVLNLDAKGQLISRTEVQNLSDTRFAEASGTLISKDGSLIIAHRRMLFSNLEAEESYITKLDPKNQIIWQKQLNAEDPEAPSMGIIKETAEGDILSLGTGHRLNAKGETVYFCSVEKLSKVGEKLWLTTIPQEADCSPNDFGALIAVDTEGSSFFALGNSVAKLDSKGQLLWTVNGRSDALSFYNERLYSTSPQLTMALSKDGKILWAQKDLGGLELQVNALGLAIATPEYDEKASAAHARLMKLDINGKLLWKKGLSADKKTNSMISDLRFDAQGNILAFAEIGVKKGFLGVVQPTTNIVKFDGEGRELGTYSSGDVNVMRSIAMGSDGSFFIGALEGAIEKFVTSETVISPSPKPAPNCLWFNPFCRK